jgi:hypothetical protein
VVVLILNGMVTKIVGFRSCDFCVLSTLFSAEGTKFIVILVHNCHKECCDNDKTHNEIFNGPKKKYDHGEMQINYKATELQRKDQQRYKEENKCNLIHEVLY